MQGHPEVAEQSLGSGITVLWGLGHDPGTRTGGICWKERRGEEWGCLRLVTVGEGKVTGVSAEGMSYQEREREGKGQGDRKSLLRGGEGWASWAQAWGSL